MKRTLNKLSKNIGLSNQFTNEKQINYYETTRPRYTPEIITSIKGTEIICPEIITCTLLL